MDYSFTQHEWPQPMPTGYTRRLLADGPLSSPGLCLQSLLACIIWSLMTPMLHFLSVMRISFLMSELFHVSHLFYVDKKGEKKMGRAENS